MRGSLVATTFVAIAAVTPTELTAWVVQRPANSPELLFVGDYYPGQIRAVTGDTMLGLFYSPNGWELASTRLTVDSVHNACADKPGEKNGRRVRIDGADTPLFLVRGVPKLHAGPARALFSEPVQLFPGQSREFEFKSRVVYWLISAFGSVPYTQPGRTVEGGIREYVLAVSRSPWDRAQTLIEFHAAPTAGGMYHPPTVLWVGDLDGDGQMDLFLDSAVGELPGTWVLYLSSLATGQELVHKVAEYHGLTC